MTQSWPNSELSEPFHVQSWTALSGVTYTVARRSPAICRLVTLVYTFINLPCTDDDVMHWWWCHALKLVTYSKIPSCTKKDPRYFFWPFTTEFSFYLKGWNNNSGQESRELIHVFLVTIHSFCHVWKETRQLSWCDCRGWWWGVHKAQTLLQLH